MKKLAALAATGVFLLSAVAALAAKPISVDSNGNENAWENSSQQCTRIKDGTIQYGRVGDPNTNIIPIGYDMWGYNYQAHMFNGYYDNYTRPGVPVSEGSMLQMKWSDEWLSNQDCNDDNKLDRGYSCNSEHPTSSACPGAWLTNHEHGTYNSEWSIIGEWVIEFDYKGTLHIHDMTIENDVFTGVGYKPSDGTTWTVEGTLTGDDVEMTIIYDGSSYYVDMVGTIASDGTMSGTWGNVGQSGTWLSSYGMATKELCEWDYFVKIVTPNTSEGAYKDPEDANGYSIPGIWYSSDGTEIGEVIWTAYAIVQEVESDSCTGEGGLLYKSPLSPGLGFYTPKP